MNPIRIGETEQDGHRVLVVELFGVPIASARSDVMLNAFDAEPDFQEYWSKYFLQMIATLVAEKIHENRPRGWLMATRLSPSPPSLPTEEEEG